MTAEGGFWILDAGCWILVLGWETQGRP